MKHYNPSDLLKTARKARGLTQEGMAEMLKITPRQYQRYEEGFFPKEKRGPVRDIDRILGTTIYGMIYDKDVPREASHREVATYINGSGKPEAAQTDPSHADPEDLKSLIRSNEILAQSNKELSEGHLELVKMLKSQMANYFNSALGHIDEELSHIRENTDMLENQIDIDHAMAADGHTNERTTSIYAVGAKRRKIERLKKEAVKLAG